MDGQTSGQTNCTEKNKDKGKQTNYIKKKKERKIFEAGFSKFDFRNSNLNLSRKLLLFELNQF